MKATRPQQKRSQILILPRSQVIRREFVLPTRNPKEVGKILDYRIPAQSPFLPGEMAWSWRITAQLPDGNYLVSVTLVEKSRLKRFLDTAGIGPKIRGLLVEDEFLSLWQSSRNKRATAAPELHLYGQQQRLLALLSQDGHCLRSNVQSLDGAAMESEAAERIAAELLEGLRVDPLTAGEAPLLRVQEDLGLPAPAGFGGGAELENPLAAADASGGAKQGIFSLTDGGWLVTPGALQNRSLASVLRARAAKSLLPDDWQRQAAGRKTLARLLLVGVLLVLISAAFTSVAGYLARQARAERREIDESRALLQVELEQAQAAQMMISNVEAWSVRGREILDIWNRVSTHVPGGVILSGLSVADNGRLTLQGSCPGRDAIVTFMEALRADGSGLFAGLVLGGLEERDGEQNFHLMARLPDETERSEP